MNAPARISLTYLVFGVTWVLLSDQLASRMPQPSQTVTLLQSAKGVFFVTVSSLLLFGLGRVQARRLERTEEEKQRLTRRMLANVHHVLRNYINQMQLLTLEAENCPQFSRSVLQTGETAYREAVSALEGLEHMKWTTMDPTETVPSLASSRTSGTSLPPE